MGLVSLQWRPAGACGFLIGMQMEPLAEVVVMGQGGENKSREMGV